MIERLQRRFIAIALLSVLLVLAAITAFLNLWNFFNITQGADQTLAFIAENGGQFPKPPKDKTDRRPHSPDQSPEAPFSTRYFSVLLDQNGQALSVNTGNIAAVTTQEAATLAGQVYEKQSNGFVELYRYQASDYDGHRLVVFLDCTRELYTFRTFVTNSLWVDVVGFLAVALLVCLFSKAAVGPIAQSYHKQKSFITNAGHELKTPLSIIAANTEVLELEAGESQWTQSIRNQVERLTLLTAQLTQLARMEEQTTPMSMQALCLSEAVAESCEAFLAVAQAQEKHLHLSLAQEVYCQGDPAAIRQLVAILLDNAVKYATPQGEIRVSLTTQGRGGRLTVQNPTQPMEPGNQSQLFERFYRGDGSRSQQTGGYGLGLSIARAIVEAHRGKISASSDGDQLTISVYLPL